MSVHIGEGFLEIAGNTKAVKRSRPGAINTASYSVMSLFAAGEQGVWFDPSDFSTLFQDSVGATPVTTVGQTVGLMLDKSGGFSLGPERLVNGDFSAGAASWATLGTDATHVITFSGGAVRYQSDTTTPVLTLQQIGVITPGRFYRVEVEVSAWVSGSLKMDSTNGSNPVATGVGTFVTYHIIPSTSFTIVRNSPNVDMTITRISVKEIAGNHAYQSVLAQRPILGRNPATGTRNRLTRTEDFSNAAWILYNVSGGASRSDATYTFSTSAIDRVMQTGISVQAAGYICSAILSGTGSVRLCLIGGDGSTGVPTNVTLTATPTRYTVARTLTAGANGGMGVYNNAAGTPSVVTIHRPQLELGTEATAYQRVGASFDVTEAGVQDLYYLLFDGTDDGMVTNTITPGTDKVQVFVGVRKLSDAAAGTLAELGASVATANGTLQIAAPASSTPSYAFRSRGTVLALGDYSSAAFAAPNTSVLTGVGNIANDIAVLRLNGSQVASAATDQGTGYYLAHPLYIGRRGGTTLPFNGRLYSLIVRFGPNLDTPRQTESYVSAKTGVAI